MKLGQSVVAIGALFLAQHLFADEEKGKTLFTQCQACHQIGPDAKHLVGPNLTGVHGRKIGSAPGFSYSDPMKAAGNAGRTWDEQSLDALLKDPATYMPGSPMVQRINSAADRRAIIAFLKSHSAMTRGVAGDPAVAPEVLAIKGDPEYGEYLASECVTCHQADGSNKGIPSITGWPPQAFVTVLHAYKNKSRENAVMQNIAGALGNEEIAALAAWFADQK